MDNFDKEDEITAVSTGYLDPQQRDMLQPGATDLINWVMAIGTKKGYAIEVNRITEERLGERRIVTGAKITALNYK